MKFVAVIQKRNKIPQVVTEFGEDMQYGLLNIISAYPKHKVLYIDYCKNY